jgi:Protein of unknown function (DUF3105)
MPATSGSGRAVAAYAAVWAVAAALVVASAVALRGADGPERVSLPPVEHVELADAARAAGCELRRQRRGERLNPPVAGPPRAAPARAGVYERPPAVPALVAALRRGVIVVHVRGEVDDGRLAELRAIHAAAPNGTIVTPNATGMRFEIGAAAYGRLLGCARLTDESIEALQLFRGRYLGSGPDA